ncbi:efflux RND transporter periplasmic adaptor subunit [Acidithiobacillus sp. IBUN Pt1247-S3]|uniref:efflux RND transporter periplasmic adaptor subunit n=1 Tax=Acidithiobacillus sp. IBUN Pt1247-S3 TaxID=3166642 RepID=UPI0034E4493B
MRWIKRFAVIIIVAVVAFGAYAYFQISDYYPSTDDAYVHAHVVNVAPRVTGHVIALYVRDNQVVHQGQPLLKIDPRAYQYKLQQAEAELAQAQRQRASIAANIASAQAQMQANQINYANAARNAERAKSLAAQRYLSVQAADNAQTKAAEFQAQIQANRATVSGATAQEALNKARIAAAQAAVGMAKLDLSETTIYASITGVVSKVDKIHVGDVVSVNQDLFPLIGNQAYWIEANYKETDLDRIHPGLDAGINVDMYPNHSFKGKVVSISGGAGNAFSLLPPENATGNWVKVTQRVPVRIEVLNPDTKLPLRIGTSATVTVTTKNIPGWVTFLQPYF